MLHVRFARNDCLGQSAGVWDFWLNKDQLFTHLVVIPLRSLKLVSELLLCVCLASEIGFVTRESFPN